VALLQQDLHVDTEVFAPLHKGQHGRQTQALMLPSAAGMHVGWKWIIHWQVDKDKVDDALFCYGYKRKKMIPCFIQSYRYVHTVQQLDQRSGDKFVKLLSFGVAIPWSLLQFTGISEDSKHHSQQCKELTPQIQWGALTEPTHIAMTVNKKQYSPCACCEGTWGSEVMSPLILNLGSRER